MQHILNASKMPKVVFVWPQFRIKIKKKPLSAANMEACPSVI